MYEKEPAKSYRYNDPQDADLGKFSIPGTQRF